MQRKNILDKERVVLKENMQASGSEQSAYYEFTHQVCCHYKRGMLLCEDCASPFHYNKSLLAERSGSINTVVCLKIGNQDIGSENRYRSLFVPLLNLLFHVPYRFHIAVDFITIFVICYFVSLRIFSLCGFTRLIKQHIFDD